MPQLDAASFPSQIFWLILSFFLLYFCLQKFFLPKIGKIFDDRANTIKNAIKVAEDANRKTAKLKKQYEDYLSEISNQRFKITLHANQEMTEIINQKLTENQLQVKQLLAEAERELGNFEIGAKQQIIDSACSAVKAILVDLTSRELDQQQIMSIVKERLLSMDS